MLPSSPFTDYISVALDLSRQGHAIQKANKKRRDAETEDSDPDVSAAADAASETQASSAQIAGFCTAVAAVQYLVLFQGGGRIVLSNGEEFGASCTLATFSLQVVVPFASRTARVEE